MGYRYPKQKTTVQPRNPYGAMQPQLQKSTGFGVVDPNNPTNGQVIIDTGAVYDPKVPTPEEQKAIDEANKRNEEFSAQIKKEMENGGGTPPGTLEINPMEGLAGEFGAPSKEQYAAADEYYKGQDYGYDPYKQDRAGMFTEQDFNPYRQAAGNRADAGNAMESQGAYNQLVSQGPASASDRMQLASDFNRRKITGSFAAGGAANERENQGAIQTGKMNIARGMDVDAANAGAQNTMMRFKEGANENRRLNLYRTKKEQELLDKRLRAAAKISERGGYGGDTLSEIIQGIMKGEV